MSKIDALVQDLMEGRISRREFFRRAATYGAASAALGSTPWEARAATSKDVLVGFSFTSFLNAVANRRNYSASGPMML